MNTVHPSMKFTLTHTKKVKVADPDNTDNTDQSADDCDCEPSASVAFLDTCLSLRGGRVRSDLYRKPSDRVQFLLPSSCHPRHTTESLPYSCALRIIRICSEEEDRDKRLAELKQMLLSRDYKPRVIDAAIQKALAIPRSEALKRVVKKQETDRKVFSVLYDPRLPKLSSIVTKHWRVMVNNDSRCREVYKKPPMVSFRRPPNLKDKLVRAKLPPTRNTRCGPRPPTPSSPSTRPSRASPQIVCMLWAATRTTAAFNIWAWQQAGN